MSWHYLKIGGSPASYTHNYGTVRTVKIHYPMNKKGLKGDGCWRDPLLFKLSIQMGASPGKKSLTHKVELERAIG